MVFTILPLSEHNAETEIIDHISREGFEFFEKNNTVLKKKKSCDFYYYISYLRMYIVKYELFI